MADIDPTAAMRARIEDWNVARRELQALNPGRGLCLYCGQGSTSGRGAPRHVLYGVSVHDVCQADADAQMTKEKP